MGNCEPSIAPVITHNGEDQVYVDAIANLSWRNHVTDPKKIEHYEDIQRTTPVPILDDFLYLTGTNGMFYTDRLDRLGITHVLNVAATPHEVDQGLHQDRKDGRTHKLVAAQDTDDYPILKHHWDECHEFIQSCREAGGKCVVHCQAGVNRSGVIVAAEYMVTEQKQLLETVLHCKKRKGDRFLLNEAFARELIQLARIHNLLGPPQIEQGAASMDSVHHLSS